MKLLKFFTKCCSQCKQQTKLLNNFNLAEVVEVDCASNEDLVDKYNIQNLPTMVLLDGDNVVKEFRGLTRLEVVEETIKNYNNEAN